MTDTGELTARDERIKYAHELKEKVSSWSDEQKYLSFSQSNVSEPVEGIEHEAKDSYLAIVLNDIMQERARQDEKWGEQNHKPPVWLTILMEEVGEASQAVLHEKFGGHAAENLREEMVQVAAVAVAFIEYLDRRGN